MTSLDHNSDRQHHSTELEQLDLLAQPSPSRIDLDLQTVLRQPSLLAALMLCVSASGLERKRIFGAFGIDKATWSRIESGDANFPLDHLANLMRLCGNEAPLIWLAERCGYDWSTIRQHASDQERQLAELRRENDDLKRLLRLKADVEGTSVTDADAALERQIADAEVAMNLADTEEQRLALFQLYSVLVAQRDAIRKDEANGAH